MKLTEYLSTIEEFLKNYLIESKAKGYILGLSGGIDSAVVALLAAKAVGKENLLTVALPINSDPTDLLDAQELANKFDLRFEIHDLSTVFNEYNKNISLSLLAEGNSKVRLRMLDLYAHGQTNSYLVLGTDNLDERFLGYFTKWGDGACDLLPIAKLVKSEIFAAAKLLGVTQAIIDKIPTAGLFAGQTDEKEMGISYVDVDNFLLGHLDVVEKTVIDKINKIHQTSEHKRAPIIEAPVFHR